MNPFRTARCSSPTTCRAEIDVGNYERFLDAQLHGSANVTKGRKPRRSSPRAPRGCTRDTCRSIRTSQTDQGPHPADGGGDDGSMLDHEIGGTVATSSRLPSSRRSAEVRHDGRPRQRRLLHGSLCLTSGTPVSRRPSRSALGGSPAARFGIQPGRHRLTEDGRSAGGTSQEQDLAEL